jgi:hypothetical protein
LLAKHSWIQTPTHEAFHGARARGYTASFSVARSFAFQFGRNLAFQFGNSRQKPFTMRQLGDAQVFPVFIGELNQERAVDLLLDRSIDVLRQFEAG